MLLATEMRRVGSEGPIMLIMKPNNTMNVTQTLQQLRGENYRKVGTAAWHGSARVLGVLHRLLLAALRQHGRPRLPAQALALPVHALRPAWLCDAVRDVCAMHQSGVACVWARSELALQAC